MVVKVNRLKYIFRSVASSRLSFPTRLVLTSVALALTQGLALTASAINRSLDGFSLVIAQSVVTPTSLEHTAELLSLLALSLSVIFAISLTALCLLVKRGNICDDSELIKSQLTLGMTPDEILRRYLGEDLICAVGSAVLGSLLGVLAVEASLLHTLEAELSLSEIGLTFSWLGALIGLLAAAAIFMLTTVAVFRRAVANPTSGKAVGTTAKPDESNSKPGRSNGGPGAIRFLPRAVRAAATDTQTALCTAVSLAGFTACFICLAALSLALNSPLFIVCALLGALTVAAVLLYLSRSNIKRRARELTAMRISGFTLGRVKAYVFKGSLLLSLLGIIPGALLAFPLGWLKLGFVKGDIPFIAAELSPIAVLLCTLGCIALSAVCNIIALRSLDKLTLTHR